jgi:nicotinamide riboside kinase
MKIPIRKIALTGGPSGGKTTLLDALKKEFGSKIKIAPEAATILYRGGFPRIQTYSGQFHAQVAILHTQRHLEDVLLENFPDRLLVCDRGSLDSLAYWPDTEEHFFKTINSSREIEFARYPCIIHLDTAFEVDYDISNPIRTESFGDALLLNQKIKQSWEGHPNRIIIPAEGDFFSKLKKATEIVAGMLAAE